jgi:protein-S-isoprenylcysteine O-methyltransferase Ste14
MRGQEKSETLKGWTLWALMGKHVMIGFTATTEYLLSVTSINYSITALGLFLFCGVLLGRRRAVTTRGRYHSAHIEIKDGQPLITDGPYTLVRHTIYFFIMIEMLGFPLIANAYYALALSVFIYIPIFMLRLMLEEKVLHVKFGSAYQLYQNNVPCLIPFTE